MEFILSLFPDFDPMRFVQMLPKMGFGMLIIFVIIGIIILITLLVNKLFSKRKEQ